MLKQRRWLTLIVGVLFLLSLANLVAAREIEPIVDTAWLEQNLDKVVVLDVRKVEEYRAGHIPGAVNVFFGSWAVKRGALLNELPAEDELKDTIGSAGITPDAKVVVVGKMGTPSERVDATRVAWTLKYAGVENVAILSGGYGKWVTDKKTLSTDAVRPRGKTYRGKVQKQFLAKKADVEAALGKAVIADTRDGDAYAGKKKLPFVARMGRIKGAVHLPTGAIYEADATYKGKAALAAIAAAAVGTDTAKEIIVYCDTGKVCSAWWFMLHELLGYQNVKSYDGSMMEWAKDPAAPMEP